MEMEKQIREQLNLSKITDLKKLLKERGLPVSGKKEELIDRLLPHIAEEQPVSVEEDILGDESALTHPVSDLDENALLGTDEPVDNANVANTLAKTESCVPSSTVTGITAVVHGEGVATIPISSSPPTIITAKFITNPDSNSTKSTEDLPSDDLEESAGGKKLKLQIPIGSDNDDEKKKSRANRFGGIVSPSSKEERAKRFGITDSSTDSPGLISREERAKKFGLPSSDVTLGLISKEDRAKKFGLPLKDKNAPAAEEPSKLGVLNKEQRAAKFGASSEVLEKPTTVFNNDEAKRKRAERFGSSISDNIRGVIQHDEKVDDEILKKRAEKFGNIGLAKSNISSDYGSMTEEEKRKKRAEKFGI